MSIKTFYANLLNAANQATPFGIAKLLAPIASCAIVHGQVRLAELNTIRNMTSPSVKPLQIAIGKVLPIQWDKEKNTYAVSKQKRFKALAELGLTQAEQGEKLSQRDEQLNVNKLQAHILSILTPTVDADADKKPKDVKAWTDKNIESQVKRLDEMDIDQLRLQMQAFAKLAQMAQNRLAHRAAESLRGCKVVGEADAY